MKYTLQYASNFFLNLHKRRDFNKMLIPSSQNLALLGNICSLDSNESIIRYRDFLDYCSKNFKNTYIVPGVWEISSAKPQHYNNCIENLYILKDQYKNISILNNSHIHIPNTDINLVGSTLWTRSPYIKHQCMFEYNYVWLKRRNGLGQLMGQDILSWHLEDKEYIRESIKGGNRYIILTHHLPHPILVKSVGRIRMESTNLEIYMKKPIEVWLGGAGDSSITGSLGICNDVFCGVNPYTTFNTVKKEISETYNPEAYISLRTSDVQLV